MALKRGVPHNFINYASYCADKSYVYCKTNENTIGRIAISQIYNQQTPTPSSGRSWTSSFTITGVWSLSNRTLFVSVREIATNLYTLWRSDAAGDITNFTKVMDFGATGGSQINNVHMLRGGLCEAVVGGVRTLYIYEYNVNLSRTLGGANDQVRIMSSTDDGMTWAKVIAFNTDGVTHQLKHGHGIWQNPVTKQLVFGSGDSGIPGTANAGQALIVWDGYAGWPADNTPLEDFDSIPGFHGAVGLDYQRTVGMLFDSSGYFYTFADVNPADPANGGIWRWAPDLSSHERVDNRVNRWNLHTGWYGVEHNGVHYWIDDVSDGASPDWFYHVYASETPWVAGSYRVVGRLCGENGDNSNPLSIFSAGGMLMVSSGGLTGKSFNQTSVMMMTGSAVWDEDCIDTWAPVSWIDPVGGSDSNSGWYPDAAWKTLPRALLASAISHGQCVWLEDGDHPLTSQLSANWSAYSSPGASGGVPGTPVQVRCASRGSAKIRSTGGSNSIYLGQPDHGLWIDGPEVSSSVPAANIFNIGASVGSSVLVTDAIIGRKTDEARPFRPDINGASFDVRRTLVRGGGTVSAWQPGGSITAKLTAAASIFDGFDNSVLMLNAADIALINCTLLNYASAGVYRGASGSTPPVVKSCIFKGPSASANLTAGSGALSDSVADYNIVSVASVPTGLQGSHGSILDVAMTGYRPSSAAAGAGSQSNVIYDYNGSLFRQGNRSAGAVEIDPPAPSSAGTSTSSSGIIGHGIIG